MRQGRQRFIVIVFAVAVAAGVFVWVVSLRRDALPPPAFTRVALLPEAEVPEMYLYGNPSVSLEDIRVRVVYFVPEPGRPLHSQDFIETETYLREALLPQLIVFHEQEFLGRSHLSFSIYPEPFFGNQGRNVYEQEFLKLEATDPLRPLENEVRMRALSTEGDLFQEMFAKEEPGVYDVLLFVYAGAVPTLNIGGVDAFVPGFTGDNGGSALVFAPVVDPSFRSAFLNAGSIVYHELLHAMGVPEQYDPRSAEVFKQQEERDDVLGRGVALPLLQTRVGEDVKRGMGLTGL